MTEIDFTNPASPYGHPLQMIDRIESFDQAAGKLVASKCVSRNEPLLQGHFPNFPILPGILQLESVAQLSALLLNTLDGKSPALRMVMVESRMKHMRPVLPGDTMLIETQLIQRKEPSYTFRARITVAGEEAAKGQIVMQCLDAVRLRLKGPPA